MRQRESRTWNAQTPCFHLHAGMRKSRQLSHETPTPPSKPPNEILAILTSVMQFWSAGLKCTCIHSSGDTFLPCPPVSTHRHSLTCVAYILLIQVDSSLFIV